MKPIILSLQTQFETLSVEAQAGEGALQQALTRLPAFFKSVSGKLNDAVIHPIQSLFVSKDLAWAVGVLEKTNYADMRVVMMPCIPGVKVDYLTYVAVLDQATQYAKQIEATYLDPMIAYLASKLNNPDSLRSLAPDPAVEQLNLTTLNQLNKSITHVTDPHHAVSQEPYGKLIKRNSDWSAVLKHCESIRQGFSQSDQAAFQRKVARLNDLLATLIQRVTQDHDVYKVSGKSLNVLAEKAYFTATAVEFYGLTYRRAMVMEHHLIELVASVHKL